MDFFSKVTLSSPQSVLRALKSHALTTINEVELIVGLSSGRELTGKFISFNDEHGKAGVVLATPVSLSFVGLDAITYLTIAQPEPLSTLLTEGSVDSLSLQEGLSRLELARLAEKLSKEFEELIGQSFRVDLPQQLEEQGARNIIHQTLQDFAVIIRTLSEDDFSLSEIKRKVSGLKILLSTKRSLTFQDKIFQLSLNPSDGLKGRFTSRELQEEINRLL